MKPPVDAPASRARAPTTSRAKRSRAASSFSPPRLTKRGPGPCRTTASAAATSRARLVGQGTAHQHPAGSDGRLGLLAIGGQAAADQLEVEPEPRGWCSVGRP